MVALPSAEDALVTKSKLNANLNVNAYISQYKVSFSSDDQKPATLTSQRNTANL